VLVVIVLSDLRYQQQYQCKKKTKELPGSSHIRWRVSPFSFATYTIAIFPIAFPEEGSSERAVVGIVRGLVGLVGHTKIAGMAVFVDPIVVDR